MPETNTPTAKSADALRRFTVRDYHRMRESGILTEDDRVELMDGKVREMSPIGPRHSGVVNRLTALLGRMVGGQAVVAVQNPVRLTDRDELQPDIALLRPRPDFYANSHPTAADVLLLIEVADTSLAYDRDEKLPLYARGGVPEVWLVDLVAQLIEQHTDPRGGQYGTKRTFGRGQQILPRTVPALELLADDVLGAATAPGSP